MGGLRLRAVAAALVIAGATACEPRELPSDASDGAAPLRGVLEAAAAGDSERMGALMADSDPRVRRAAILRAIGFGGGGEVLRNGEGTPALHAALPRGLDDPVPDVRSAAAFAIGLVAGRAPGAPTDSLLIGALDAARDPAVRSELIRALGRGGSAAMARSFPELVDAHPREVLAAASDLAARGAWSSEARDALVAGLRATDPEARAAAARGLAVSGAPDLWIRHRNEIREALADWGFDEPATRYLLTGFGRMLLRSRLAPWAIEPRDARVRLAAVRALASHPDGVATVPDLVPALDDEHPWVRDAAAEVLARYPRASAAVEALAAHEARISSPDPARPADGATAPPQAPVSPQPTPGSWTDDDWAELMALGPRPRLTLLFDDGSRVEIALDAGAAPATVLHLRRRVDAGAYDGVPVHRVVPGALVQMGTPERTGAAPPLELAPTPFTRGSVGWASSGPDGDDDLFVTTDDLPELTGRHTRLGTVVSGLASLERLGPDRHVLRASFVVDPGDESAL